MTGSEIRYTITSDDKDINKALLNLQKQFEKAKDEVRKLKDEAKKSTDQSKSGFGGFRDAVKAGGSELRSMALQVVSIQAAIGIVSQAYGDWRQEMERAGETHKKLTNDIVKDLTKTGDIVNGQKIEEFLGAIPGATRDQGRQALAGVSAEAPTTSIDRRLELAKEVATQAPTGADLHGLGAMAGRLQDITPDKSANDIVDLATKLQARAGADAEKLGGDAFLKAVKQLAGTGAASAEDVLGMGLAALDANLKPSVITQVAEAVAAPAETLTTKRKYGQRLTKEETLKNKFAEATAPERLTMLREDKATAHAVLGQGQAFQFQQISKDLSKAGAEDLQKAQTGDYAKKQLEQLGGFQAGREAVAQQQVDVHRDQTLRAESATEAQAKRAKDFVMAGALKQGPLTSAAAAANMRVAETGIQDYLPWIARKAMRLPDSDAPTSEKLLHQGVAAGAITADEAERFRQSEKLISEQIAAMKENTQAMKDLAKKEFTPPVTPSRPIRPGPAAE